jgi:hypothetical protein
MSLLKQDKEGEDVLAESIKEDNRIANRLSDLLSIQPALSSALLPACKHYGYHPITLQGCEASILICVQKDSASSYNVIRVDYKEREDFYYDGEVYHTLVALLTGLIKRITNKMAGR